jgi:MoxR-like ATPase
MDRFLLHVMISYPDDEAEAKILRLVRGEEGPAGSAADNQESIAQESVFRAREEIREITMAEAVEKYIVALVAATRYPGRYDDELAKWIHVGASPRGTIALDKASRAHAWLRGSDFVTPDDVIAVAHDCLRHRLMLSYEANAEGVTTDDVIREIVKQVAVA